MAVQGEDPSELLQATGRDAALFRRGVVALGLIEDDRAALTAFDGVTGPLKPLGAHRRTWDRANASRTVCELPLQVLFNRRASIGFGPSTSF